MPPRYSRHYYDIYCLSNSWVKSSAYADIDLLIKVANFKDKFYPRSWARYEDAKPGSIKLMPPTHSIKILEDDYIHMQGMIFGNKPDLKEILDGIQTLENEINNLA